MFRLFTEFNPTTKNYDTYLASGNASLLQVNFWYLLTPPAASTNFIASGMGFFIKGDEYRPNFDLPRKNARVTIIGTTALLNNLMGKPVATAAQPAYLICVLKLITDSINNDDVVIRFDNKASSKFVNNADAQDLGGGGSAKPFLHFHRIVSP